MHKSASGLDRPSVFTKQVCSGNRGWTDFGAYLCYTSGGYVEEVFGDHVVTMQLAPSLVTTFRYDGVVRRERIGRGDLDIVTPGFVGRWEEEGPGRVFGAILLLPLMQRAAEALELDLDRAPVEAALGIRDEPLAHLCWALMAELESANPVGTLYAETLAV